MPKLCWQDLSNQMAMPEAVSLLEPLLLAHQPKDHGLRRNLQKPRPCLRADVDLRQAHSAPPLCGSALWQWRQEAAGGLHLTKRKPTQGAKGPDRCLASLPFLATYVSSSTAVEKLPRSLQRVGRVANSRWQKPKPSLKDPRCCTRKPAPWRLQRLHSVEDRGGKLASHKTMQRSQWPADPVWRLTSELL